jgi:hypothetical protein
VHSASFDRDFIHLFGKSGISHHFGIEDVLILSPERRNLHSFERRKAETFS